MLELFRTFHDIERVSVKKFEDPDRLTRHILFYKSTIYVALYEHKPVKEGNEYVYNCVLAESKGVTVEDPQDLLILEHLSRFHVFGASSFILAEYLLKKYFNYTQVDLIPKARKFFGNGFFVTLLNLNRSWSEQCNALLKVEKNGIVTNIETKDPNLVDELTPIYFGEICSELAEVVMEKICKQLNI